MPVQRRLVRHALAAANDGCAVLPRGLHQVLDDAQLSLRNQRTHHRRLVEWGANPPLDTLRLFAKRFHKFREDGSLDDEPGTRDTSLYRGDIRRLPITSCTEEREELTWPLAMNEANDAPLTATVRSTSAVGLEYSMSAPNKCTDRVKNSPNINSAALPPNSAVTLARFLPAMDAMTRPEGVPPVTSTFLIRGSSTIALPVMTPNPGRTERTPSGTVGATSRGGAPSEGKMLTASVFADPSELKNSKGCKLLKW